MLRGALSRTVWGRMLTAIAFLAMAVRAVIPAGYMLADDRDSGRFVTIELCSAHGSVEALLDRETGAILDTAPAPKPAHDDDGKNTPCVFAAAAHLAAPEHAPALIAAEVTADAPSLGVADMRPGLGLAAPPPWSTGPPPTA